MNSHEEDWKDYLSRDSQKVLAELLEETSDHKGAYLQADDVKVAQLWCALIEMKKMLDRVMATVAMTEEPFKNIAEVGEEEKRRAVERIVRDLVKPTDQAQEESTKKLVESLMKF